MKNNIRKQKTYAEWKNAFANQNAKVRLFLLILFTGMACSVIFHYINSAYLQSGYPYNTFLFLPSDVFNDFFHTFKALSIYGNPYSYYAHTANAIIPYLPFTFVVLKLFTPLAPYPALFLLLTVFVVYALTYFYKSVFASEKDPFLRMLFTAIFAFCSYPFLFLLDRANVEIFTFIALTLFFIFYKKKSFFWAPLFLAISIAMKLYPGVLVLLFFADKRYKDIMLTAVFTIAIVFLGYVFIAGTAGMDISTVISNNLQQLALHKPQYAFKLEGLQHNHTLWGLILGLNEYYKYSKGSALIDYNLASNLYLGIIIIICIIYAVYIIVSRDAFWKKTVVLMSAMLVFPYTSFDYSLIHWMICAGLYLAYDGEERFFERIIYIALFAVPLIPLDYKYITRDVSITVFLYPLAIMAFSIFIIFRSFFTREEIDNMRFHANFSECGNR